MNEMNNKQSEQHYTVHTVTTANKFLLQTKR